jgi:hypothetical protein
MWYRCPKCNNVWSGEATKKGKTCNERCPLHPDVVAVVSFRGKGDIFRRSAGIPVGDIAHKAHGYYAPGGGGRVLPKVTYNK